MLFYLFFLFTLLFSFSHADNQLTIQQAETTRLEIRAFYTIKKRYTGKIKAQQSVDLSFELSGKIQTIQVNLGDQVKKGQLIATIDPEIHQLERQELEQVQLKEKARLNLLQLSFERAQKLIQDGHIIQQEYDEIEANLNVVKSSLNQIKAAIQVKTALIARTTLLAPFDGTITQRFIDEASIIKAGTPIVEIQQDGNKEFIVGLAHKDIDAVDWTNLQVTVNQQPFTAKWLGISNKLNPITQTQSVRLGLMASEAIATGQFGYLDMTLKITQACYSIPYSAITAGPKGTWLVMIAKAKDDQFIIATHAIDIIHSQDQVVFIKPNLPEGMMIITSGLNRFVKGQYIQPIPPSDSSLALQGI